MKAVAVAAPRPTGVTVRHVVALLIAVALVLVTVGCTSRSMVASVDGRVVLTTDQLARIQEPVAALLGDGQGAEAVISIVILGELAPGIAEANNVQITEAQQSEIATEAAKVTDPEVRAVVEKFYFAYLVFQSLNQQSPEAWTNGLATADVEVNPRYGSWADGGQGYTVVKGGSLSQPSVVQSASAAPSQGG